MPQSPLSVPRRSKRSPIRRNSAFVGNGRRILDAAARLFVERGYAGTTVNAVATEAGVVAETIYSTLGGKPGLLKGVLEASRGGTDNPFPFEQVQRWDQIAALDTARDRLRAWVAFSGEILARTGPIHTVIRGAADGEAFAAELRRELLQARRSFMTELMGRLLGGALRPGLTIGEAGERFCALVSPELHALLTTELGWTPEQHQHWIGDLLETDVNAGPMLTPGTVRTTV